ncbi:unnamed protein product [Prorocentrum cordatum]|uniref:Protein kinase domain-containing protein n=1 Tax=Prorocentrum cordatum TaxID=2364126 RepID=A0ABN9V133_9DINO|nr:unnamed protein product [Polarella glacialis]
MRRDLLRPHLLGPHSGVLWQGKGGRLRRLLESELPGARLDDAQLEFVMGILEEEEIGQLSELIAEMLGDAGGAGAVDAISQVLERLGGAGESPSELSRASSHAVAAQESRSSGGACGDALELCLAERGEDEAQVAGLQEWLERLGLARYAAPARAWCEDTGAQDVAEIAECWEQFCGDLGLKPLERRRVGLDCRSALEGRPGDGGGAAAAAAGRGCAGVPVTGSGDLAATGAWRSAKEAAPASDWQRSAALRVGSPPRGARADRLGETVGPPGDEGRYTIARLIGTGATSRVYECARGGERFAVKAIGLRRLPAPRPSFERGAAFK